MKTDHYTKYIGDCYYSGNSPLAGSFMRDYSKGRSFADFVPYKPSGFVINQQGKFKIGGRNAPKQTPQEFIKSMRDQLKKEIKDLGNTLYRHEICIELSLLVHCPDETAVDNLCDDLIKRMLVDYLFKVSRGYNISYKFQNDLKYKNNYNRIEILGQHETIDGIQYLEVLVKPDYSENGPSVAYYIYFDGKFFRVYTPSFGNWVDTKKKIAFGFDSESDMSELRRQGVKMDEVNESPEEVIVRLKPSKYTFTVRSNGGCNGEVKTGDNYYDPWLDVCRKEFEYRLMKKN